MIVTVLVTRLAVPPWPIVPGVISTVHLFLLDQGTRISQHSFNDFPPGQRVYCAYSRSRLEQPVDAGVFEPGGLASLGEMIRESQIILSHPNAHSWSMSPPGLKRLAITLGKTPAQRLEGVRLACGLAGCGHGVMVLGAENFARLAIELPQAAQYLAVLPDLGVTCFPIGNKPSPMDAWLEV